MIMVFMSSSSEDGQGGRPRVTVVSGFDAEVTADFVRDLAAARPSMRVVRHDISQLARGRVQRLVSAGEEVLEFATVEMAHGCLSCTVREDVLPTLVRLARVDEEDILLVLPDMLEPESIALAASVALVDDRLVSEWVRFGSFVTVVDARTFIADVVSEEDLADRGLATMPDDMRTVAGVAVRQVEYADLVLISDSGDSPDQDVQPVSDLLTQLAPWAKIRSLDGFGPNLIDDVLAGPEHDLTQPPVLLRGIEGRQVVAHEPGGHTLRFTSRRPMHPGRFDAALGELIASTIRGRGHLWFASQPETIVVFESAGAGVGMGGAGWWLAEAGADEWAEVSPSRRTAASLGWDEYFADRTIDLVFSGITTDPDELRRLLDCCLLTDDELAAGFDSWRALSDPFAGCFDIDLESAA